MGYEDAVTKNDAAEADFTANLIAEALKGLPADDPDEVEAAPEPGAVAPEAGEAIKLDAPVKPPAELTPDDRGSLRLLEREQAVRDREQAAEKALAEARALRDKLEQAPVARGYDKQALADRLMDDPVALFEELGADPAQVNRLAIAGFLGDKAPPELRTAAEAIRMRREIDKLRREMKQAEAERTGEAERVRVKNESRDFASRVKGDSTHPTLTAVAKVDPEHVTNAIFEVIAQDARARGIESRDQLMSPEKAAAIVEKEWAVFARAFAPAVETPGTNVEVPAKDVGKGKTVAPPATQRSSAKPGTSAKKKPYYEEDESDEDKAIFANALKMARGLVPPG